MRNSNFLKTLFAFAFGFLFSMGMLAQTTNVTGRVTGNVDGLGIPGVSILIKGTTRGTITDMDGNFSFQVMKGETMVFSFIGMKTQEIVFSGKSPMDVAMEDDFIGLDEVVAIGYGSVRKEDLTGSVTAISSKDFNVGSISSPQELVNGKIAGVQIVSDGGAPGAKSTIRIRGGSSLKANNDPLIIIDGVPMSEGDVSGMRNPLNVVNPNDIETFTVLKDASATAIYGSRASNGVILITTKKGADGGIKVDYTGSVSVSTPASYIDMMDASQYRETLLKRYPQMESAMGSASTDWQKEIYTNAISTDHNVSVGGSIGKVFPFRASVGHNISNGILDKSQMKRTTATLNLSPKLFEDHLSVNAGVKGMYTKNNFSDQDAIGAAIGMDPTQVVKSDDAKYDAVGGYFTWLDAAGKPDPNAPKNGRARIDQKIDNSNVTRVISNFQMDYKMHFLPELRANLNLAYEYSKGENDGFVTVPSNVGWDAAAFARGGAEKTYSQTRKNSLLDFYLQYQKELGKNKLDIMGGYSYQHYYSENEIEELYKIADGDGGFDKEAYRLNKTENYLVSFFGRLNYNYDQKYFLTATLRQDGSSRFGKENRWGFFPSVALSWNLKNEGFLYDNATLSSLKLRTGYGITGQQGIEGINYGYFGIYKAGEENAAYVYYDETGKKVVTTIRPEGYDANLKWEETATYNVALDYGFFNNRIYGSLDVYLRQTTDLLNEIDVPALSNLKNRLTTNVGDMENKGIEFSVNSLVVTNSILKWEIGANLTYNENKITKLTKVDTEDYIGVYTGDISGGTGNTIQIHQVGSASSSFFVYEQVYDQAGKPIEGLYVDRNKDGQVNESDKYVAGSPQPKYMLGINTKLSYFDWDLSLAGRANFDMQAYDNVASNHAYYSGMQTNGQYLSNLHTDVLNSGFETAQYFSDYYLKNATFFRMDNISLGYNLANAFGSDIRMRISASVNNAFIITKYKGLDPEIQGGIDNNLYPRPRTFMLGLNMSF